MKFPLVSSIASTSIITIGIERSVAEAMDMMLEYDHRNVIVEDNDCYRILTIIDILNIQKIASNINVLLSQLNLPQIPKIEKNKNVLDTLEYLNDTLEFMCVVNTDNSLYGLITHTDITSNIDPHTLMENYRLMDFLKLRHEIRSLTKDTLTAIVIEEMTTNSVDNVIIVENMKPIGILTTKDILRLIRDKSDVQVAVSKYMTSPIDTIHESSPIKGALELVKQKHYKRVVVVNDEGVLVGIITQRELISLTYERWATMMNQHQEELSEINSILEHENKAYKILASIDSLTGLYNRDKFSELYMSSYLTMTQRENSMSMLLLDIDSFKKINDTYGHNMGDKVLIQISDALLKNVRSNDIVCRWGGEEFLILLPTINLENATILAKKLKKQIEEMKIDVVGNITASFGVAEIVIGEKMNNVIDRADKALYLAKHSGRNCVKTELDI